MIYFGYPLDIHGWKTKPETESDWFRDPNPNPQDSKPTDIQPETAPLPSLGGGGDGPSLRLHRKMRTLLGKMGEEAEDDPRSLRLLREMRTGKLSSGQPRTYM